MTKLPEPPQKQDEQISESRVITKIRKMKLPYKVEINP
jgi:hypothetical protein